MRSAERRTGVILTAFLIVLFCIIISKGDIVYAAGDYGYTVNSDGTITISEYTGNSTNVTIPSVIDNRRVTKIGEWAFYYGKITSVTIPDSITSIDKYAFAFCDKLTTVNISANTKTLGDYAFGFCENLNNVNLPASVSNIGEGAFTGCKKLTALTVNSGNNYYKITDGVLFTKDGKKILTYLNNARRSYTVPSGVNQIFDTAFFECESLANIVIPNSVTNIGKNTFEGCTNLVIAAHDNSYTINYAKQNGLKYGKLDGTAISGAVIRNPRPEYLYTGGEQKPGTEVSINGNKLVNGKDFLVFYDNNIDVGTGTITVVGMGNYSGIVTAPFKIIGAQITYQTHVQSKGWIGEAINGQINGTVGEAKRVEAVKIKFNKQNVEGSIRYRAHVEKNGWMNWMTDGALAGTSGEAKRLEAIQISLTGELAEIYDIYYRVHSENFGWLDWAKNGEVAGTSGYAYRVEAIQIKMVAKGSAAPGNTENAYRKINVRYRTHVQDYGWQNYVTDGAVSGTTGHAKKLEAINMSLVNQEYSGSIQYRTHVEKYGWMNWVTDGKLSGTTGQAKRLEAIQIVLTGEMANYYDVYYRTHAQKFGWLGWAKNGEMAGTAGYAYRLEAIEVVVLPKGSKAPGATGNAFVSK